MTTIIQIQKETKKTRRQVKAIRHLLISTSLPHPSSAIRITSLPELRLEGNRVLSYHWRLPSPYRGVVSLEAFLIASLAWRQSLKRSWRDGIGSFFFSSYQGQRSMECVDEVDGRCCKVSCCASFVGLHDR